MISAFSQKIAELESKLDRHERSLQELTRQKSFDFEKTDKEKGGKNIPSEVQHILLSFQGELKDQSFTVNTLQSRVYCQQEEIRVLRSYIQERISKEDEIETLKNLVHELAELCAIGLEKKKEGGGENTDLQKVIKSEISVPTVTVSRPEEKCRETIKLNPEVPEFKPRNPQDFASLPWSTSANKNVHTESETGTSSSKSNINSVSRTKETKGGETMESSINKTSLTKDKTQYSNHYGQINKQSLKAVSDIEGELDEENFSREIMQQKLSEKNRVILEAEWRLDEALSREAKMAERCAWAEHKVGLLKHDKRQRAETIGKLLRCVDSLSDLGHLDLTSATSERAILTTTLSTRGMPHEERIQVAINVTEAEQLHEYRPDHNSPHFSPGSMDKDLCDVTMSDSPTSSTESSQYEASCTCSPTGLQE